MLGNPDNRLRSAGSCLPRFPEQPGEPDRGPFAVRSRVLAESSLETRRGTGVVGSVGEDHAEVALSCNRIPLPESTPSLGQEAADQVTLDRRLFFKDRQHAQSKSKPCATSKSRDLRNL